MGISAAERTALREAVRDLMRDACTEQDVRKVMSSDEGFDRGLWRQLAELGVVGMLIGLARSHGRLGDPVVRYHLAKVLALRDLNALNNARAKAATEQEGTGQGTSSPVMSLGKLAMANILHAEARLRTEIAGPETLLAGAENPEADDINFLALNAFFTSIGGGTDQIQRNIIGERVLGLPKEPEIDRKIPFREVRRS